MHASLSAYTIAQAFRYYGRRVLRGPIPDLAGLALRSTELSPAAEIDAVPPFFRGEHLPRITDAWDTSRDTIINENLNRKTIELHPARLLEFRDATLLAGSLYLDGRLRMELRAESTSRSLLDRASILPSAPFGELDEGALVAGVAASTWFGHWLIDELPGQIAAEQYSPPVAHVRIEYSHEPAYRAMLDLKSPARFNAARIRKLFIVDEFAQNPHKARRYRKIRTALESIPRGKERVVLNRGGTGARRTLENESEVLARLVAEGFHVVDMEGTSFEEIARQVRGADIVVSLEGSHLAHAVFMLKTFGSMIILNPPWQVHTTLAEVGLFCGLHSAMYICEPATEDAFRADPDELLSFVDEALRDARTRRGSIEGFVEKVDAMAAVG